MNLFTYLTYLFLLQKIDGFSLFSEEVFDGLVFSKDLVLLWCYNDKLVKGSVVENSSVKLEEDFRQKNLEIFLSNQENQYCLDKSSSNIILFFQGFQRKTNDLFGYDSIKEYINKELRKKSDLLMIKSDDHFNKILEQDQLVIFSYPQNNQ